MGWLAFAAAFFAVIIVGLFGCAQLPSSENGVRLLEKQGFTDVRETGRAPFAALQGCSDQDVAIIHFRARNVRGQVVDLDVCQGWPLKGATLRE
jgi:hypothetical protein